MTQLAMSPLFFSIQPIFSIIVTAILKYQ